jgi:hypothetical protein
VPLRPLPARRGHRGGGTVLTPADAARERFEAELWEAYTEHLALALTRAGEARAASGDPGEARQRLHGARAALNAAGWVLDSIVDGRRT